jgi:hypothetical protein
MPDDATFLDTILELNAELEKFASLLTYLEKYSYDRSPNLARLCTSFRRPGELPSQRLRQIKWVTAMVGLRSNVVTWLLMNLILPWDFLCAFLAAKLRARAADLFPTWLETWYELECPPCRISPTCTYTPSCGPQLQNQLSMPESCHPLIPNEQRVQ